MSNDFINDQHHIFPCMHVLGHVQRFISRVSSSDMTISSNKSEETTTSSAEYKTDNIHFKMYIQKKFIAVMFIITAPNFPKRGRKIRGRCKKDSLVHRIIRYITVHLLELINIRDIMRNGTDIIYFIYI